MHDMNKSNTRNVSRLTSDRAARVYSHHADEQHLHAPVISSHIASPRSQLSTATGAYRRWAKRFLDIAIVICSLPVFLPVILLVAVVIKIEDPKAPVFFTQLRTGLGGKRFGMFKFRTMVVNADEIKSQLAELNSLAWPDFKIVDDPRITRIGRLLRKTSIDELPQLFNILLGHMSLVGPRPTSFDVSTYNLWQSERLEVRPGLTGLWQIAGRGQMEFDQRVRLDIAYIKNRSLLLDLKILFLTVPAALRGA